MEISARRLMRINSRYSIKVGKIKNRFDSQFCAGSSFSDITDRLLAGLSQVAVGIMRGQTTWAEQRDLYFNLRVALKSYIDLFQNDDNYSFILSELSYNKGFLKTDPYFRHDEYALARVQRVLQTFTQ